MQNVKGLPSLRAVRSRLGLSMAQLASMAGLKHPDSIRFIETGLRDCTQATQRAIADALCCTVADLLEIQPESKLDEIEANYLSKRAFEAHAKIAARGVA